MDNSFMEEIEQLRNRAAQIQVSLDAHEGRARELQMVISEREDKARDLDYKNRELDGINRDLERTVERRKYQADAIVESMEDKIEQLTLKVTEKMFQIEAEMTEQARKFGGINEGTFEDARRANNKELDSIKEAVDVCAMDVASLSNDIRDITGSIAGMSERISGMADSVVASVNESMDGVTKQLNEATENLRRSTEDSITSFTETFEKMELQDPHTPIIRRTTNSIKSTTTIIVVIGIANIVFSVGMLLMLYGMLR